MQLIYIICYLGLADMCEEHRINLYDYPYTACLLQGNILITNAIKGRVDSENWIIKKWRCE